MANGKSVAIEDVPDDVFSSKMMGEGIAILPDDGNVYAPCDGCISMLMEHSLHAFGIVNEDGMEVLVHIGIDSVNLMGEGFHSFVKKGDQVKKGDLVIQFDGNVFKEHDISSMTMMILVEPNGYRPVTFHVNEQVQAGISNIIEYK